MSTSIRLGRVAGIEIGVNWTWFVIAFLLTWTLAVGLFPETQPGVSAGARWAMAVVASLLFFASILLHELGHALQARRDDVEIEGITLWLFGGVARFSSMYRTAGAEFRIAIAGPVVTAVIAGVLIVLGVALPLPDAVDGVVTWLGYINAVLLVFNLLPALPLDGGRLLHAALWAAKRDLVWATRVGAAVGVGFGWAMIGAGVVMFFFTAAFGGLWLALIGWFLASAARAESRHIIAREALGGTRVAELMARDPVSVEPDVTLGRFMDEVARTTRFTTYPVVEDGRPVGLLTFRRVAEVPRSEWETRRVRDCMIAREDVPVVGEREPAADAMQALGAGGVNRALVVDGGRLVGLLSITDLARAIQLRDGSRAPARSDRAR